MSFLSATKEVCATKRGFLFISLSGILLIAITITLLAYAASNYDISKLQFTTRQQDDDIQNGVVCPKK